VKVVDGGAGWIGRIRSRTLLRFATLFRLLNGSHDGQRISHRGARVQGVDRDPLWVEKAAARATAQGLADRFSYRVSVAEELPFADASFDLVTCQPS